MATSCADTVTGLARLSDPSLAEWIDTGTGRSRIPWSTASFPRPVRRNSRLARAFGIEDAAPVTHENYRQWVIEDAFCAGRPDWDRVGATFTDDVHDYETMKIRILNAGHQVLANAGELLSLATIADCMATRARLGSSSQGGDARRSCPMSRRCRA
jgi:mannitol 2-dehydrogenase